MKVAKPVFKSEYNLDVSYRTTPNWRIECSGDCTYLFDDLKKYGIVPKGELRKNVDIKSIVAALVDDNLKRRFLAGIADTIGSTTPSHRRFSDDTQIISFEIAGFNYEFVCDLCKLLSSVGCYPDQVLWNHPNMHSGRDTYYKPWKKGFKLRVTLDQYTNFGAFAFKTKAKSSQANRRRQRKTNIAEPCKGKSLNINDATCFHPNENSNLLPEVIRGGHYIHHKHFCAVLGCENAPYRELDACLLSAENYVNPFAILHKGTSDDIDEIVRSTPIMDERCYVESEYSIKKLLECYSDNPSSLLLGDGKCSGYPISTILDALAYLVAAETGQTNGKRPKGNRIKLLSHYIASNPGVRVTFRIPDLLTPLIIAHSDYAALVGPQNPVVYKKLISFDPDNKYKLLLRQITEADLR